MKLRGSVGQMIFDTFNLMFILILAVITFYPIWFVFCASFSDSAALISYGGILLYPLKATAIAYTMVFKDPMILKGYANTLFIVVAAVVLNLTLTFLGAYVLAKKQLYWNKLFTFMVILTMFFSGGLIPTYLLVTKTLGLNNSYWALILPQGVNVFNLIMVRTFFQSLPDSLEEAAKLDGASYMRTLTSIVLPLSKAIIAVMVLYYAVQHWNSWFDASIYLKTREKFPLQLILREILIQNDTTTMAADVGTGDQMQAGEAIKYAVISVATLPILCVFPFLQKHFAKGVMIGALKG